MIIMALSIFILITGNIFNASLKTENTFLKYTLLLSCALMISFLDLPDLSAYREHFEFVSDLNWNNFSPTATKNLFEPGYEYIVFFASRFLDFFAFHTVLLFFIIYSYLRLYEKFSKIPWLSFGFFIALFLYFISFTLRASLASGLICFSIFYLLHKRYLISYAFIILASTVHVISIFFIFLPLFFFFRNSVFKYLWFLCSLMFLFQIFIGTRSLLILFENLNLLHIVDKVVIYNEHDFSFSLQIILWLLMGGGVLFLRHKLQFQEHGKELIVVFSYLFFIVIATMDNGFVSGRFSWFSSFFIFIFVPEILRSVRFNNLVISPEISLLIICILSTIQLKYFFG